MNNMYVYIYYIIIYACNACKQMCVYVRAGLNPPQRILSMDKEGVWLISAISIKCKVHVFFLILACLRVATSRYCRSSFTPSEGGTSAKYAGWNRRKGRFLRRRRRKISGASCPGRSKFLFPQTAVGTRIPGCGCVESEKRRWGSGDLLHGCLA